MMIKNLFIKLLATKKDGLKTVSIRDLHNDPEVKRQVYARALEAAAVDQNKVIEEYNKKLHFQG